MLADAKKQLAVGNAADVKAEKVGNYQFIGKVFDGLDPKELRGVAEGFAKQADIVVVATNVEGKASVVVASKTPALSAVTLVQTAVAELGGKGGGGKPDMAQGGGPDADKLLVAIDKIKSLLAA